MVVGEFLTINNYRDFDHVLRTVNEAMDMDPALVFQDAAPGFLGQLVTDLGAWRGREQFAFAFPSANVDARAVGPDDRARLGDYAKKQVVGVPGFEVAGFSHRVLPTDFLYGGMNGQEAARRAARPRLSFNQLVAKKLMDTVTQGDFGGSLTENFAWSATNFNGETITQLLATQSADQVATVVANATQTIKWPKRDGSDFAAGHDHVFSAAGAAWTLALARTHAESVLEHPGAQGVVAYVGSSNRDDIRTVLKSEYGAIPQRVEIIHKDLLSKGGFASAYPLIDNLEGVTYFYAPDLPADAAIYAAGGQRPFYMAMGQLGVDGSQVGTRSWSEPGNPEVRGTSYGYRDYLALGCLNPIGVAVVDYVA